MTVAFYKLDEMQIHLADRATVDGGMCQSVTRLACRGDKLSALECDFPKGYFWAPHAHAAEQLSICVYGKMEYTVDGETHIMEAGDTMHVPSGSVHAAVALEPTRLIDVFTPVRKDHMAWFDDSITYVSEFLPNK